MSAPSVSIVIPAKNGIDTIVGCLDGVIAQEYEGNVDVLVVDSGSTDGTLEEIATRPSIGLHRIHPTAFDHGDTRNLGAGLTHGELIVFLVQDAEPVGTRWLADLVSNFDDPQVAGAFSRILPRPEAGPLVMQGVKGDLCFGTERTEVSMESPEAWAALDPHSLRLKCNFNDVASCLRRTVWEQLPFVRGMFGEDIKFARAAIEAGWTVVFDPRSEVIHSHEYEAASVYARTFVDGELNMRFLDRPCIDKLSHAFIMTGRSWKADRQHLAAAGLPLLERWKWSLLSPVYHFAEFFGFWRGAEAVRNAPATPPRVPRPVPQERLKILFVVHAFPPDSWAGVEVLTLTLARALRARGHDVVLFVRTPGNGSEPDRSLHAGEFEGFRVHRFVNRLAFSGVDETYRFRPAEEAFDQVLAREQPDVVHIQHMIHLSTGIIDRCRSAGVPSVVTLSDFWARCPRVQLIRPDRTNCLRAPPGLGCAACVKDKPKLIDPLAVLDRIAGSLPAKWAEGVSQTIPAHPPGWRKAREDAASLVRREDWMRSVLQRADALVVPSHAVKQSMIGLGIPAGRLALSAYGLDTSWIQQGKQGQKTRPPAAPLRVGFVGSLVWYKGLQTLAAAILGAEPGTMELHVHGDDSGGSDPATAGEIRALIADLKQALGDKAVFHGRFHHDDLAAIHADLDVLVVPSLWQEAYGLTVREAFLSGTPVVGSDIAGISEGIEHDANGLLFEPGSAPDLLKQLRRLVDEPSLGPRLVAAAPPVKTDAEEACEMEWRYRQVIGLGREAGRRAARNP